MYRVIQHLPVFRCWWSTGKNTNDHKREQLLEASGTQGTKDTDKHVCVSEKEGEKWTQTFIKT